MSMLTEKLKEYEKKMLELETERKRKIEEKVETYRKELENEANEELNKIKSVYTALKTVVEYEAQTVKPIKTESEKPTLQEVLNAIR